MAEIDTEKFRLRRFVEHLNQLGELETIDTPVDLADLSSHMEAIEKAILFKQAGPEKVELVANVNGSRARLAAAMGGRGGGHRGRIPAPDGQPAAGGRCPPNRRTGARSGADRR